MCEGVSVIWFAVAALFAFAIARIYDLQTDAATETRRVDTAIIAANIAGCERANEARSAIRALIDNQIQNLKDIDPALFPDIPPDVFQTLLRKRIRGLLKVREKATRARCVELFPEADPADRP